MIAFLMSLMLLVSGEAVAATRTPVVAQKAAAKKEIVIPGLTQVERDSGRQPGDKVKSILFTVYARWQVLPTLTERKVDYAKYGYTTDDYHSPELGAVEDSIFEQARARVGKMTNAELQKYYNEKI